MGQLVKTMSSIAFLKDIINPARETAGENPVRNRDFIARIEDELDDLPAGETFVRYGNEVKLYQLNLDQMLLVGMRESKSVRRSVLAKLKAFEASTPTTGTDSLEFVNKVCETDVFTKEEKREMICRVARDMGFGKYMPDTSPKPASPTQHTPASKPRRSLTVKVKTKVVNHGKTFEQAIAEFVNTLSGTGCMSTEDAYLMFCEMYGTNMAGRNKFVSAVRSSGVEKQSIRFDRVSKQGFKFLH